LGRRNNRQCSHRPYFDQESIHIPNPHSGASMIQRRVCLISCPVPRELGAHSKAFPQRLSLALATAAPHLPKGSKFLLYRFVTEQVA
jgi:hypothetical protein